MSYCSTLKAEGKPSGTKLLASFTAVVGGVCCERKVVLRQSLEKCDSDMHKQFIRLIWNKPKIGLSRYMEIREMNMTAKHIAIGAAALTIVMFADLSKASADTVVEPSPVGQMASALNPMNWKMPKFKLPNFRALLPSNDEQTRIKKKKDGLFDEVGKTASNSWGKTKQALNPQNLNPAKFFPASARMPSAKEVKEDNKPGFFRSLFSSPEKEESNATVTDFLGQARPTP